MTGLFLVDGHQLLYRTWFGFPARITSRDKTHDLTGVFGFLALMRKAHRLHAPDNELVVIFDSEHAAAGRAAAVPGYKADRATAGHSPVTALAGRAAVAGAGAGAVLRYRQDCPSCSEHVSSVVPDGCLLLPRVARERHRGGVACEAGAATHLEAQADYCLRRASIVVCIG